MISIFSDLVEQCLEIFIDDFSVYGDPFEDYLTNLGKVLRRCWDKYLTVNWEKCHSMIKDDLGSYYL